MEKQPVFDSSELRCMHNAVLHHLVAYKLVAHKRSPDPDGDVIELQTLYEKLSDILELEY